MPRILFVCTGNICRSPMAEALLKERLERAGRHGWSVASAGTWTVDGAPASRYAALVMAERGLDLGGHRSRVVNREMLEATDLVLVMTQNHSEALRLEFPDQSEKIILLSEIATGYRFDIQDPYGGTIEEYQTCAQSLATLIDEGCERILHLAQDDNFQKTRLNES